MFGTESSLGGTGFQRFAMLSVAMARPNILFILADDFGLECVGAYGGLSYRTPNLDRVATEGTRFDHCYSCPLCTPTRIAVMTGQYNFRNYTAFGVIDPREKTFAHYLQEAGYKTCCSGKWQLYSYNPPDYLPQWRGKGTRPRDSGFDEWCLWHAGHTEDSGSRYADPTVEINGQVEGPMKGKYGPDVYAEFLLDFARRHQSEPWFIYYPMALPHVPIVATPHSYAWDHFDRHEHHPRFFPDMVEYLDTIIGRIREGLASMGQLQNTLICFSCDHGTPTGIVSRMRDRVVEGGKRLPTDAGTHVPLLASWQGVSPAGKACDDLIDSTDFLPTFLDVAGVEPPAGVPLDGRSFAPQLRGQSGNPKEWAFMHHAPAPGWDKEPYRLIRWARTKRYKLYGDGKLYDIPNDPDENHVIWPKAGTSEAEEARIVLGRVLDKMRRGA